MAHGDVHIIGQWGGSLCGKGGIPTTRQQCQECVWAEEEDQNIRLRLAEYDPTASATIIDASRRPDLLDARIKALRRFDPTREVIIYGINSNEWHRYQDCTVVKRDFDIAPITRNEEVLNAVVGQARPRGFVEAEVLSPHGKVLILVLSHRQAPYDVLHITQRQTWDSIDDADVYVRYYWGDGYESLPHKLIAAIDAALLEPWDFIFRTNSSSYVDKHRLASVAKTLPRERCYCGVDAHGRKTRADAVSYLDLYAIGCGFFISRDCAEILHRRLLQQAIARSDVIVRGGEDVVIGEVLAAARIPLLPGTLHRYWQDPQSGVKDAYLVRCKSPNDRSLDVIAMREVHAMKNPA